MARVTQLILTVVGIVVYLTLFTVLMSMLLVDAIGEEWPPKYKPVKVYPEVQSYRNKDYIIVKDIGGYIGEYIIRYRDQLKDTHIIVDGLCNSACTLVLSNKDVCVTDRAWFGFHEASTEVGTQVLMNLYPEHVKAWIAERGGLTAKVLFARGHELAARCKS